MRKLLIILSIFFCTSLVAQNRFVDSFAVYNTPTNRNNVLSAHVNKDSYKFMTGKDMFNGWLYMYMATKDTLYGNFCKRFVDSVRASSAISNTIPGNTYVYKDGFYGWTSKSSSTVNTEVPLYESYITDVIFEFFYFHSLWSDDTDWLNDNIQWFTDNLWTKWKLRSRITYGSGNPYRFFLRSRTHDGAHWAIVASILTKIGLTDSIRSQAADVVGQYDILIQRNLKNHPTIPGAYTWNGSYDDVTGTQANAAPATPAYDDVSHANHTVRYMYFAELLGNPLYTYSTNKKVAALAKGLYDGDGRFWDLFDQEVDTSRANNWGSYHGDGWMLYSKYDTALYNIYVDRYDNYNSITKGYNQTYEYPAQLALAYFTLNSLPDTVRRDTANNIGVLAFRKTIAIPDPTVSPEELDNVKATLSNGIKYRLLRLGENQSSYFGVYPDDNAASMMQAAFNRNDVKSILLSDDTVSVYDVGKLNASGGVLRFANGAKITSADTISNLIIDANSNAEIISGAPVFTNLKTNNNKFYAAWVGVKGDGGNYTSRLNYAMQVAANNKLELVLPEGIIYADAYAYLRSNLSLTGSNTTIKFKQGSGFREFASTLSDIKLSNLNIQIVDTTSGNGVPAISLDGASYGIKNIELKNIKIDANRKALSTIRIDNADSVVVDNAILTNSNSESIYATSVKRLTVSNTKTTNSGTSAIVATTVKDMKVNNVYVKGISLVRTSGSSYGISITSDSTGNEINNAVVIVDSSSNSTTNNYPFKLASPGILLSKTAITAAGQNTTYAILTDVASNIIMKDIDITVADKAPARLIYIDNVKKLFIDKLNVSVNNNATGSTMKLLYATGSSIDSIEYIALKNITLNNFTKSDYLFDIRKRTVLLSVDGLNIDSLATGRMVNNTDTIVHFSLNKLNIKSSRSGAIISLPATVKSFLHTESNYIKGDTVITSVNSNVSAKQESIYVNGKLLWEASGGGGGDVNMTDTLPGGKIASKFDLSQYTPTVRTLTAAWGLQGGGNLTANRPFNVDSSLVTSRARLKHVTDSIVGLLAGYDTLTATFTQVGDSIIITIGAFRGAIYNQATGGGSSPTKPDGYILSGTGSSGYDSTGMSWDKTAKKLTIPGGLTQTSNDDIIIGRVTDNLLKGVSFLTSTGIERAIVKLQANTGEFRIGGMIGSFFPTFYSNGVERMRIVNGTIMLNTSSAAANITNRVLYVNGSIGANKDSIPLVSSITTEKVLLQDTITGQHKRVAASVLAGGGGITALTGDVTASGTGSVAATIATSAVTNAKMANMTAETIKGRTGSTGAPQDLTVAQVKTLLGIEQGSYTATVDTFTSNGSVTYLESPTTMYYEKNGTHVHVWGYVYIGMQKSGASDDFAFSLSLPFSTYLDDGNKISGGGNRFGAGVSTARYYPVSISGYAPNTSTLSKAIVTFYTGSSASATHTIRVDFNYIIE